MQEGTRRVQRWGSDATASWQFASVYGRAAYKPEERLLAALLMDALMQFEKVYSSHDPRGVRTLQELQAWFYSDDDSWPFSFENVCAHLHLEPGAIRSQLARLRRPADPKVSDDSVPTSTEH